MLYVYGIICSQLHTSIYDKNIAKKQSAEF